ncbi:hypothetical protein QQS21_007602 [Conoideocrella luteorostrata]|uniref:Uncharacterized protein n=1 Tax=Conoideocrella luteorostrata TaxID=1105319 RepID=A0AAJ0CMT6_9HYPO|nr:hypothetical protein QQS21_007602 [Conoideocrella luteorostrata]
MFLPDHRINKASKRTKSATLPPGPDESSHLHKLQDHMPVLFDKPSNLFDPFASPSLFFHSPGLLVPQSFFMSVEHAALIDGMTSSKGSPDQPVKVPRKSHLVFPPRKSTLKIPETLLLFDSAKPPAINPSIESKGKRKGKQAQSGGHSFKTQAMELAELMRRSIDVVELKERSKWDEDIVDRADEAVRRVQVIDIGPGGDSIELTEAGNDAVASWMENKI